MSKPAMQTNQTSRHTFKNFLLGNGPKVVSAEPMVRRQGNGNFTGFVRKTYSDGLVVDADFVMNAKTKAEVVAAYASSGWEG